MKLKDLIQNHNFCWFEMKKRKFVLKRNYEIREFHEKGFSEKTLAFYEENRNEEVKIIKTVSEVYKKMGY